ncbi:MAG TPA: carboxypeptidase-like regulatory domain-containing protein, partial [Vicinamibacteria bacterium]
MHRLRAGVAVTLILAGALAPALAVAQTTTSTLQGHVLDRNGSAIPGARVDVKGETVSRAVVTDETGFYRALALAAGSYSATVSKDGFTTAAIPAVTLLLDTTVTLDVTLEVATRGESVTVLAEAPLVDATTSTLRQAIDSRTIASIPLNGRNYLDLVLLTPGVAVNTNARSDLNGRDTRGS